MSCIVIDLKYAILGLRGEHMPEYLIEFESETIQYEDAADRGFCYPAMFFTKDNALLCGYCRGGGGEETICLQRLGIMKMDLCEI